MVRGHLSLLAKLDNLVYCRHKALMASYLTTANLNAISFSLLSHEGCTVASLTESLALTEGSITRIDGGLFATQHACSRNGTIYHYLCSRLAHFLQVHPLTGFAFLNQTSLLYVQVGV